LAVGSGIKPNESPRKERLMQYVDLVIKGYLNASNYFQMNVQMRGLVSDGGAVDNIPISLETITKLRERYQRLIKDFHHSIYNHAKPEDPSMSRLLTQAAAVAVYHSADSIESLRALRSACGEFMTVWDTSIKPPALFQEHYHQLWQLGNQMLQMLPGTAKTILRDSIWQTQSRQAKQGLRVILDVAENARSLLDLPWELLVIPTAHQTLAAQGIEPLNEAEFSTRFLFLHHHMVLIRQVSSMLPYQPITIDRNLALQVIAAPLVRSPIDTRSFIAELAPLFAGETLERWWSSDPNTIETLHKRLLEHQPQIVQLLCHGHSPKPEAKLQRHDMLVTYILNNQQVVYRVSSHDLWPILSASARLQLVVLTVCHSSGAQQTEENTATVSNIAYDLVRAGVPMVIGMQGAIAQHAAARFCGVLYTALREGHTIEWAITAARAALSGNRWFIDWTIPVVYRQADQRERPAWHTRLADFLDARLLSPSYRRGFRAAVIVLALGLIIGGLSRAIFWPSQLRVNLELLRTGAFLWAIIGVTCTLLVDHFMTSWRPPHLAPHEIVARRYASRGGMLLGYAIGGWAGALLLGGLFLSIGELISPPIWQALFLGLVGWSSLWGYVVARSESRAAHNNWRLYPQLYVAKNGWLSVYLGMLLLLFIVPLGLLTAYGQSLVGLILSSGLGSAAMGVTALTMIYSFDRERRAKLG